VLFSQTEPRDLDAIAARCGDEVAHKVAQLGRHDYLTWDMGARRLVEYSSTDTQIRIRPGDGRHVTEDGRRVRIVRRHVII
jgi:hypothetical protein